MPVPSPGDVSLRGAEGDIPIERLDAEKLLPAVQPCHAGGIGGDRLEASCARAVYPAEARATSAGSHFVEEQAPCVGGAHGECDGAGGERAAEAGWDRSGGSWGFLRDALACREE